jgi:hypothetical protein
MLSQNCMTPLPDSAAIASENVANDTVALSTESKVEQGDFHGCNAAEWALWRALKSQGPRAMQGKSGLPEDTLPGTAAP